MSAILAVCGGPLAFSLTAPPETMRQKVERLEREIAQTEPVDCPVVHHFAPGLYAREMTIPAGTILTGAVHKTEHLSIISAGRILVTTDDGVKEICAPYTFVSKAGAKRAGVALETTVWTTLHVTEETDLDKLCLELTESQPSELMGGKDSIQVLANAKKKALEVPA